MWNISPYHAYIGLNRWPKILLITHLWRRLVSSLQSSILCILNPFACWGWVEHIMNLKDLHKISITVIWKDIIFGTREILKSEQEMMSCVKSWRILFELTRIEPIGLVKKEQYFVSEILTYIFDIERVLLQPANSLLQPAKKVSSAPFTRPWFGGIASGGQNLYYI